MENDIAKNETQTVFFSDLPSSYDLNKWKMTLESFGHVMVMYFSNNSNSGYALYETRKAAVAAAEALHETVWPPESSNKINFQLIANEELDTVAHLGNSGLQEVSLFVPESGASLFKVTKVQPPIYWSLPKTNK